MGTGQNGDKSKTATNPKRHHIQNGNKTKTATRQNGEDPTWFFSKTVLACRRFDLYPKG